MSEVLSTDAYANKLLDKQLAKNISVAATTIAELTRCLHDDKKYRGLMVAHFKHRCVRDKANVSHADKDLAHVNAVIQENSFFRALGNPGSKRIRKVAKQNKPLKERWDTACRQIMDLDKQSLSNFYKMSANQISYDKQMIKYAQHKQSVFSKER